MLKGKNIILRPLKKSDISYFLKWYDDPEITKFMPMYLPLTDSLEEKWFEEVTATQGKTRVNFVIEKINNNKTTPIGSISLNKIDHKNQTAEYGISIGEKEYWGKGYGNEATRLLLDYGFQQLNLNRIDTYVFAPNKRSLKLVQKIGFIKEGIQRQTTYKNGMFIDKVIFGLLRDEWKG